jgi:tight adherence protein B
VIRRPLTAGLAGALALATALAGNAGAQETEGLEFVSIDKRNFPEMTVTVAPTGELAELELDAKSFEVRQDGEKRRTSVERVEGSQIEIAIVIDTSAGALVGSLPEGFPSSLDASKVAARDFLDRMTAKTEVAVLGFGDAPYVAQPLTTDVDAAAAAIDALEEQGETALYDGLNTALEQFSPDAQRVIILLSNGADTRSASSLDSASSSLAASGVALYAVNVQTGDSDPAALETMAEAANGQVIEAADENALQGVYDSIATRLVNQYQLTFDAEGKGRPSELEIDLREGDVAAGIQRVIELPAAPTGPDPEAVAAARPTIVEAPGGDWALPVGLVSMFAALLVAGLILMAPRKRRKAERTRILQKGWHRGQLSELTNRATQLAERSLEQRGRRRALTDALEYAGMAVRPGEFIVLAITSSFVSFVVAMLVAGPIIGAVLGVLVLLGFRFSVSVLADRRRSKFGSQLGDTLQLLSGSLRAGYGMLQALDAVARDADSPTAEEFGRVVIETRLGRNVSESLHSLARRMGNEDFEWVVQAIDIHREVGGDLTEVLDTVAATIRDRDRLRRQIRALSAEGRLSAAILFGLPFAMFLVINFMNPEYMAEMTGSTIGRIMLGFGALLLLGGGLWLKKIVKLEF